MDREKWIERNGSREMERGCEILLASARRESGRDMDRDAMRARPDPCDSSGPAP
jgi:hypothetical protein